MEKDANCLFCKIAAKEIPAKVVSEGDHYIAIRDINPQAPTHVLVMPKHHVRNVAEFGDESGLGRLFHAANKVVESEKLANGFRLVVNTGADGGQTVDHLHIHVIGGRSLSWPPG